MNVINFVNLWFLMKMSDMKLRVILVDVEELKGVKKSMFKYIVGKL